MAEKEEVKSKQAELVEIPTQTTHAVKIEDGSVVEINELLVMIYNKLIKIEKAV